MLTPFLFSEAMCWLLRRNLAAGRPEQQPNQRELRPADQARRFYLLLGRQDVRGRPEGWVQEGHEGGHPVRKARQTPFLRVSYVNPEALPGTACQLIQGVKVGYTRV
jgi:hypothetical protein